MQVFINSVSNHLTKRADSEKPAEPSGSEPEPFNAEVWSDDHLQVWAVKLLLTPADKIHTFQLQQVQFKLLSLDFSYFK